MTEIRREEGSWLATTSPPSRFVIWLRKRGLHPFGRRTGQRGALKDAGLTLMIFLILPPSPRPD